MKTKVRVHQIRVSLKIRTSIFGSIILIPNTGSFGYGTNLPVFYDFVGVDGSGAVINAAIERRSFSLAFGQQTALVMDSDYISYGTISISGQEFVHLTVDIFQDDITRQVWIEDSEGREVGYDAGADGYIIVIPFRPSSSGTFIVRIYASPTSGALAH